MKIKAMSKQKICDAYCVSLDTFYAWMVRAKLIGENCLFSEDAFKKIRIFTPSEVESIYQALGEPD